MQLKTLHIKLFLIFLITLVCTNGFTQMVISPGSSITLNSSGSLYVGTSLTIKSNSTQSGHLADQNSAGSTTITGTVNIERYLTSEAWHNVTAPLNNANSSIFGSTELFFYYDETIIENDWNFGWVMYEGALSVMKGYDLYIPGSDITATFSGTASNLNTGSFSMNVYKTDPANGEIESHKGWNLLGNPYPSPVDWQNESGWTKTNINNAKYIWNPSANNYTIWLGGNDPIGLNGGTQYIPASQGFWVQATQNGSVSINNTSRVGIASSTPGYYKNDISYPFIKLEASANNYVDECIIRFLEYADNNFNLNLDASKLYSPSIEVPQIESRMSNQKLAINSLKEIRSNLIVDLYFRCGINGDYKIKITELENISDTLEIFLRNVKTNKVIPISKNKEFCFTYNQAGISQKFQMLFSPSTEILNQNNTNTVEIFNSGNTVRLYNLKGEKISGDLIIYDIRGKIIEHAKVDFVDVYTRVLSLKNGYYIIRFISSQASISKKINIINVN